MMLPIAMMVMTVPMAVSVTVMSVADAMLAVGVDMTVVTDMADVVVMVSPDVMMPVTVENPVTRDPDQGQQPVEADRDQEDGQRQHRCADSEFPNFLHDGIIPPKAPFLRDYKSRAGFETEGGLDQGFRRDLSEVPQGFRGVATGGEEGGNEGRGRAQQEGGNGHDHDLLRLDLRRQDVEADEGTRERIEAEVTQEFLQIAAEADDQQAKPGA